MKTLLLLIFLSGALAEEYLGVSLGDLRNETMSLHGEVYLANSTTIQLVNFRINSGYDIKFFFTAGSNLKHAIRAFEVLSSPGGDYMKPVALPIPGRYKAKRLVIVAPSKLNGWKFFGIVAENGQDFMAAIKLNKRTPQSFCCIKAEGSERSIVGGEYGTEVGPIAVIDHKTIQLNDFTLEGTKPPDAWIFAGNGDVSQETGKKALVQGRDTEAKHCPIHEDYRNGTLIVRLAGDQTIYDINYISVFCYEFSANFGSVNFHLSPNRNPVPVSLPPISDVELAIIPKTECEFKPELKPAE